MKFMGAMKPWPLEATDGSAFTGVRVPFTVKDTPASSESVIATWCHANGARGSGVLWSARLSWESCLQSVAAWLTSARGSSASCMKAHMPRTGLYAIST